MSAGKNRQQDQNSFSSAVITKSAGLSFLEALFIGLALMALIGGGLVQAVQKTHQTKILIITENGEAIAQWLHSAYLLKQISTPSDDLPCKGNSIDTELACFQEMLDRNSIFSTLKNPFSRNGIARLSSLFFKETFHRLSQACLVANWQIDFPF